jgi:tRNA nucleotidyltransferase (CCA-adding enzyme)
LGLEFLRTSEQLRFFPELEALQGVPQDPTWHPEGDVWVHTLLSIDAACDLRAGVPFEDEVLMFGVLCHDLGKPAATDTETVDGRIRSHRHQQAGLDPTRAFLSRLRASGDLVKGVEAAVLHHLTPSQFVAGGAKAPAYRRLASKLSDAGVSMALLERVARADHLGRTTDDARARVYPAGDQFLAMAAQLAITHQARGDVVQGRHLIATGRSPGPEFGAILAQCRDIQDETGATEPEVILQQALDAMSKKA